MPQPDKPHFAPKLKTNPGATGPVELHPGIINELLEQPSQPAPARIGRPKGPLKVKKTFYITEGSAVINQVRLLLAQRANFVVKDESVVAEVAFKLLADMINDPEQFDTILERFKRQAAIK